MKYISRIEGNKIKTIFIEKYDIYESEQDRKHLFNIIKTLANGDCFFYLFRREEDIFMDYEELIYFRSYIPEYFKERGKYKVIRRRDETMFDSCGMLPVNDFNILFTLNCWRYFWAMSFFCPDINFTWENYLSTLQGRIHDLYGKSQIQKSHSDSMFIRGHDGESLIFSYDENKYLLPDLSNLISKNQI